MRKRRKSEAGVWGRQPPISILNNFLPFPESRSKSRLFALLVQKDFLRAGLHEKMSPGDKKKIIFFLSLFVAFVVYTDFLSPGDKNEFLLAGLFFFRCTNYGFVPGKKKFTFARGRRRQKKSV